MSADATKYFTRGIMWSHPHDPELNSALWLRVFLGYMMAPKNRQSSDLDQDEFRPINIDQIVVFTYVQGCIRYLWDSDVSGRP